MLKLTIIMNSDIEEILEFKCCNLLEMNLELIFQNIGEVPMAVPNGFILESNTEREVFNNIYPPWKQIMAPGEVASIYCSMDETVWDRYRDVIIADPQGTELSFPIPRVS